MITKRPHDLLLCGPKSTVFQIIFSKYGSSGPGVLENVFQPPAPAYFALVLHSEGQGPTAGRGARGAEPGWARTGAGRHSGSTLTPQGDPGILWRYGSAIYFGKKKLKIEKLWM